MVSLPNLEIEAKTIGSLSDLSFISLTIIVWEAKPWFRYPN